MLAHPPSVFSSPLVRWATHGVFALVGLAWFSGCSSDVDLPSPGEITNEPTEPAAAGGGPQTGNTGGTDGGILDLPVGPPTGGSSGEGETCSVAILGDPGSNPAANFSAWLGARGPMVTRYAAGVELTALTASELAHYDVVLLDWLPPETLVGVTPDELSTWVQAGGRLLALSGYGDYPEALAVQNELLAPLHLGFVTEQPVWGPVTSFTSHPINRGLTNITFVGGREVLHDAQDDVIMTINDPGVAVGVTAVRGNGRAFVFGDEWITYDSEWEAIPEIQQLWVNIFDWLGDCQLEPIIR